MFWRAVFKLSEAIAEKVVNSARDPEGKLWQVSEPFLRSVAYGLPNTFNRNRLIISSIKPNKLSNKQLSKREFQVRDERIFRIRKHNKPFIADMVIQDHNAERAGLHWDMQINMDGQGHRWVIKRRKMPPIHDRPLKIIQQPTHNKDYVDFSGEIPKGYGKGRVKQVHRGQCEVMNSNNDNVDFVIYDGQYAGRYKAKRWYLKDGKSNVAGLGTPTNEWMLIAKRDGKHSPPHIGRPTEKIRDVKQEFSTDTHIITEKYDGTHSVLHINKKRYGRNILASRRVPKDSNTSYRTRGGLLHQEDNLPWIRDLNAKYEIAFLHFDLSTLLISTGISFDTMREIQPIIEDNIVVGHLFQFTDYNDCIFHVEVYHNNGNSYTSGLMNSNPLKAREMQAKDGRARVILTDVRKYQGSDVRNLSYEERYSLMKDFAEKHPNVEVAERCPDNITHSEFHKKIMEKGGEGTVIVAKEQKYGEEIFKVKGPMDGKFMRKYYIVGFVEGKGKLEGKVGTVAYSNIRNGEPIGYAAPNCTEAEKQAMWENQDQYIGKSVIIESPHKIPKGNKAVRAPNAQITIHEIDRGPEPGIKDKE